MDTIKSQLAIAQQHATNFSQKGANLTTVGDVTEGDYTTVSGNATLSGTYSYGGDTFYDGSEESELTIYYELEVRKKKSTYDIVAIDEDGNPVQYLYSETITIDEDKQL